MNATQVKQVCQPLLKTVMKATHSTKRDFPSVTHFHSAFKITDSSVTEIVFQLQSSVSVMLDTRKSHYTK